MPALSKWLHFEALHAPFGGVIAASVLEFTLEQPQNLVLLDNKHPLVPESTLRAGHRLVQHGLASEMLYELLVRTTQAQPAPL